MKPLQTSAAGGSAADGPEARPTRRERTLADDDVRQRSDGGAPDRRWSIGELATEAGVSTRTIRFYETCGLIAPGRSKGARIYGRRDRARMYLILRGKNLGFSLEDIREYLALYDDDPNQIAQTQLLLQKVETAIAGLESKKVDIERTLSELKSIRERAELFLSAKSKS